MDGKGELLFPIPGIQHVRRFETGMYTDEGYIEFRLVCGKR
jgi:hypothetical protein